MKYIIFVPDGAADYPVKQLNGRTPLQAAHKPHIDKLACISRCGLFKTIPDGFQTGSAVANLSILGYDPLKYFQGRGVLEAASMGVSLDTDDVALRCNTVCVEDGIMRSHSAGHITTKESGELICALNTALGSSRIKFYPGVSYRHLLVLKGGYSPDVECFPPHDHVGKPISSIMVRARNACGEKTAKLLNRIIEDSYGILSSHPVNSRRVCEGKQPANTAWPWSPGRMPKMKPFTERFGIKAAVISAVDLVQGLGIYAGFDVIRVKGATGLWDTNYEGKADACIEALREHDLVYVHVEASDEAGHEGNPDLKIRCIEFFDQRLVGRVLSKIDLGNITIALLPDHPTPVSVRGHTSEPVPFLIYKPSVSPDSVSCFDEQSCAAGSYGLLENEDFIHEVFS